MKWHSFLTILEVAAISAVFFVSVAKAPEPGEEEEVILAKPLSPEQQQVESQLLKKANENIEKYRKADAFITFKTESGDSIQNAEVQITQNSHDFLFGALIFDLVYFWEGAEYPPFRPDLFKKRFKELFNFAIFPFYWGHYEPTQGMPTWERMLPVIEWCKSNGITTKGHPLVWTHKSSTPNWLTELPFDLSMELSKARVINIVRGFKGKIDIWDVVNEPVNTKTWRSTWLDPNAGRYIEEPIQDIADYVDEAFRWAYTANPKANLILNDYFQIAKVSVRKRFFDLVKELKHRDTPISGLGIQAHEPLKGREWYPPKDVLETLDYLGSLGYPLHITEFMPQSSGMSITGGWREGAWTQEKQAEFAEQFYRLCFGHPSVVSINWWGFSDRTEAWAGRGLVNADYSPKPVYNRLKRLIHEEWKTKINTGTDNEGAVKFRGFFGEYVVDLKTKEGRIYSYNLHLRKDEANKWVFTVTQAAETAEADRPG